MSSITPQRVAPRLPPPDRRLLRIEGDVGLVERLEEPLRRALGDRRAFYEVRIDAVGRCGEVLICIVGAKGRLPLIFGQEELEPGYVVSVVRDTVDKFGF
jgi:hypothetical protein